MLTPGCQNFIVVSLQNVKLPLGFQILPLAKIKVHLFPANFFQNHALLAQACLINEILAGSADAPV